jgi:hypothetical protein
LFIILKKPIDEEPNCQSSHIRNHGILYKFSVIRHLYWCHDSAKKLIFQRLFFDITLIALIWFIVIPFDMLVYILILIHQSKTFSHLFSRENPVKKKIDG